ncbi:MAG: DUF3575 domain-containing protein [Odoribacteraceae bacterium]|jgi:hypothetical protein|nr:DUF3575 domain-containing protein [Odoribacteraceae bacterium]
MITRKNIRINVLRIAMLAGLLSLPRALQAQSEIVRFESRDMTVEEIFLAIMRQTPYTFVVNHSYLDVTRGVTLSATGMTLDQAVTRALEGTGNEYEIRKQHIIIKRAVIQPSVATWQEERARVAPVRKSPFNGTDRDRIEKQEPSPATGALASPLYYYSLREIVPEQEKLPRFEIKTNLLQVAATTPHLGIEIGLGNRTTLEISGSYNPWRLNTMDENNKKRVYWIALAEARYWSCERFNGHFFGVHAFHGRYNISNHDIPLLFDKQYRYEGNLTGAGISYGYNLMIDRRWSVELNAGIGLARVNYDRYSCRLCAGDRTSFGKLYFGPTRAGITLAYILK